MYTYWLESELAINVGFRFDANLIYIPVYWNQMIRRCDLGSFKGGRVYCDTWVLSETRGRSVILYKVILYEMDIHSQLVNKI